MILIAVSISVFFILWPSSISAQENEIATEKSINDTILELFNNCNCTPYYLCSEANKYTDAVRANLLTKDMYCTNTDFFCCQNSASTEPSTISSTTERTSSVTSGTTSNTTPTSPETTSTTTEIPTIRHNSIGGTTCGVAKTQVNVRVLNPEDDSAFTMPGEIPWMVEIFKKKRDQYLYKCAGTLIHSKVVLTATHCVVSSKADSLKVIATGLERFQKLGAQESDEQNVQKIIKHPKYYSGGLYNDIALLILENGYNFSKNYLNSICIPSKNASFDGKTCIAAGWGRNIADLESTPVLSKVDVPVVNFEKCEGLLKRTRLGDEFNLHSSFMCAGGEKGKDTCKGDGGGPLMCIGDNYEFVQVGIVAWGVNNECGVENQPGIYTNVGQFTDWITDELGKHNIRFL